MKKITLQTYAKNVFENCKEMPDPVQDAERFSTLHSWYKHLDDFVKMYPILMEGEEVRYDFDTSYRDKDQSNYHWRFILERNLDSNYYKLNLKGEKVCVIPEEIKAFMKKFPIYVSYKLGGSKFQIVICKYMAKEFWAELKKTCIQGK